MGTNDDRWAGNTSGEEEEAEEVRSVTRKRARKGEDAKKFKLDVDVIRQKSFMEGCRKLEDHYELYAKISSGSFGTVHRARRKVDDHIVALKCFQTIAQLEGEGLEVATLREVTTLFQLRHPNVVDVLEVVMDAAKRVYLVMEYAEHELWVLLQNSRLDFAISERKRLALQLLQGVAYIHSRGIVHRDIKPHNLLYSHTGEIKICDFGASRRTGPNLTPNVGTLWYRSPEELMGFFDNRSGMESDAWSVGCVIAEIFRGKPLFTGGNEFEMLQQILTVVGTPKDWPQWNHSRYRSMFNSHDPTWRSIFPPPSRAFDSGALTDKGMNLISGLLTLNPANRLSPLEAIKHPFFEETPLPKATNLMPTARETNVSSETRREDLLSSNDLAPFGHDSTTFSRRRINPAMYLKHLKSSST